MDRPPRPGLGRRADRELTRRGNTVFLTLRDPVAAVSVRVICPRTVLDATDPPPGEGARVLVWAKPDFNTNRGSFSLSTTEIRAVGIGELLARLERLRRALAAEGLFAEARKRPLPFLPGKIGLICGRDSAAKRTCCAIPPIAGLRSNSGSSRWPSRGLMRWARSVNALHRLDADPAVDVIVIARGGGSIEDLLPFSDETLIRAVAAAKSPVVSAIGHEQDTPLLDLVADVRASTPTDAARRVVPDVSEQLALIAQLRGRARRCLTGRMERESAWLAGLRSRPALASPVREIKRRQELITGLTERARRRLSATLDRAGDDVSHVRARLLALSPATTLRRGYAIVQRPDGSVVRAAADVPPGQRLTLRFADDQLTAVSDDT